MNKEILSVKSDFIRTLDAMPKTIETYNIALNQFLEYIKEKSISNPTREDIIEYRKYLEQTHKPTTTQAYIIAVKQFYKFLEQNNICDNVAKDVRNIKIEDRHLKRGLSEEEIKKCLDVCKDLREIVLLKLMISTGLRCNEVINIRLNDFFMDDNVVMLKVLGKGRDGYKQDVVKIDDRVYDLIYKYIISYQIKDYLFVSSSRHNTGGMLTTKTIRLIVKNIFKRANLTNLDMLSAHSTRHTTAQIALQSGLPLQEVSECMRHKNIATTMIYSRELDKKNSSFASNISNILF